MIRQLGDAEVDRLATPQRAVEIMRAALLDLARGELVATPRTPLPAGATALVVGAGGRRSGPVGFRAYGGWGPQSDQLTAAWDGEGRLLGVVTGELLGILRTGALGGVAVDALAVPDADRIGVVGSGRMAWGQVWAASAVRPITAVDVFSPSPDRREAFARRVESRLGIPCRPVSTAAEAVADKPIVVLSTTSTSPVLRLEDLSPRTHVNSTGPKRAGASELDPRVAEAATAVVTDAPGQVEADDDWFSPRRPDALSAVLAGQVAGRRAAGDLTLYCSVGLTGTEPLLAAELLSSLA